MSQGSFVRPPRIASWLVDLFTPSEQAESIVGDLLEEFSEVAAKSGVASARRWYWRQSVESIAHLIGTGFRVAPWTIAGAVVVGILLRRFGSGLTEHAIEAFFDRYPIFAHHHWHVYVFCVTHGILIGSLIEAMLIGCIVATAAKGREMVATMTLTVLLVALIGVCSVTDDISIGRLIESMLIGCIVAMAAKGREMVATMTLTVLLAALNGVNLVQLARHWPELHRFLLPILVFILGDLIMIVAGGGIVRKSRSTAGRRPSSA
jgi:biotin transporter BioY